MAAVLPTSATPDTSTSLQPPTAALAWMFLLSWKPPRLRPLFPVREGSWIAEASPTDMAVAWESGDLDSVPANG